MDNKNTNDIENLIYNKFIEFEKKSEMYLEGKIGRVIAKSDGMKQQLELIGDGSQILNQNPEIQKHEWRFESQVNEVQYKNAIEEYKEFFQNEDRDYLIDLSFNLDNFQKVQYRVGMDPQNTLYSYERLKNVNNNHYDVIDQGRNLRLTFSDTKTEDHDSQVLINCIQQKDPTKISAIRLKQSIIFQKDGFKYTFSKVQQINEYNQEVKMDVYELLQEGNLKNAIQGSFSFMESKSNYFKYQYEIEMEVNISEANKDSQQRKTTVEKFLKNLRSLHDTITTQESKKFQEQLDKKKQQKQQRNQHQNNQHRNQNQNYKNRKY